MSSEPPSAPEMSRHAIPGGILAGKYRLESLIGHGGMGSVWRAMHLGLHQPVAIKLVAPMFVGSADARRRFDNEAKAVAQLKSRHVVQVYDNGILDDGTPFIAMELLEGEPLSKRIHASGPLPIIDCARVVVHVARALSRAHALNIIHRDIKPENIFLALSPDEEGFIGKVLDFGIAKIRSGDGDQHATRTGSVLGTPLYMSPEQARGLKSVDHRSDLYSLGLVAYTMLTGNLAFSGESYGDLLLQICTQPLPAIRPSAPWVPVTLEAWFQRASAREPADRFASAQELADAFAVAGGFPGGAASVSGPVGPRSSAISPVPRADVMPSWGGAPPRDSSSAADVRRAAPTAPYAGDSRASFPVVPANAHSVPGTPQPTELSSALSSPALATPRKKSWLPVAAGVVCGVVGLGIGVYVVAGRSGRNPAEPTRRDPITSGAASTQEATHVQSVPIDSASSVAAAGLSAQALAHPANEVLPSPSHSAIGAGAHAPGSGHAASTSGHPVNSSASHSAGTGKGKPPGDIDMGF